MTEQEMNEMLDDCILDVSNIVGQAHLYTLVLGFINLLSLTGKVNKQDVDRLLPNVQERLKQSGLKNNEEAMIQDLLIQMRHDLLKAIQ